MKKHLLTSLVLAITLLGNPLIHAMDQEKFGPVTSTTFQTEQKTKPETETLYPIDAKTNNSIDNFLELPLDSILDVLNFLTFRDLMKLAQVSKGFTKLLETPGVFKEAMIPKLYDALLGIAALRPTTKMLFKCELGDYYDPDDATCFPDGLEGALRRVLSKEPVRTLVKRCLELDNPWKYKMFSLIRIAESPGMDLGFFQINDTYNDIASKEAEFLKSHSYLKEYLMGLKRAESGYSLEGFKKELDARLASNRYSLAIGTIFKDYAYEGNFNNTTYEKERNNTLVYQALKYDMPEALAHLLNYYNPNSITVRKKDWFAEEQETLLSFATKRGFLKCIEVLIQAGAEVNGCYNDYQFDQKDHYGLRYVDIDSRKTPLHYALESNNRECLEALLPLKVLAEKDKWGNTLLSRAACVGDYDYLKAIIIRKDPKDDINTVNNFGNTPLYRAAREGHTSCVQLLLENNADTTIVGQDNKTALEIAKTNQIAQMIAQKRAQDAALKETTQTQASLDNTPFVHLEKQQPLASPELEPLNAPLAESDDWYEPQSKRQRIS